MKSKIVSIAVLFLVVIFLGAARISSQSLKPESPYPLKTGINKGTADSLVGTHYWYFWSTPGGSQVKVRFANATALYGAAIRNTTLTVTLYDDKKTWRNTKVVSPARNQTDATFTAEKVKGRMKVIVAVAPPNQNLIRMGGDYEIEVTGDVAFDDAKSAADPIVRTYSPKVMHYSDDYGSMKFLADGTIETANGFRGTWKAFDRENRIYALLIEGIRYSVQYRPGYGLVKPDNPNDILFQELKH